MARAQGDYGAARRAYEESAAVYRRLGNRNRAAGALGGLGLTLLDDGDPAMRLPILLAEALREHIIGAGLLTEPELDAALRACERRVLESETLVTTFLVVQVWGRKAPA